jgi:hypothetical protein
MKDAILYNSKEGYASIEDAIEDADREARADNKESMPFVVYDQNNEVVHQGILNQGHNKN